MKKYRSKELDNLDRPGPFETFKAFHANVFANFGKSLSQNLFKNVILQS